MITNYIGLIFCFFNCDLLVYIMAEGVGVQLPDLVHLGLHVLVELVVEQDPADGQAELAEAAEGNEGVGADGDVLGVLLANPIYRRWSSLGHMSPRELARQILRTYVRNVEEHEDLCQEN